MERILRIDGETIRSGEDIPLCSTIQHKSHNNEERGLFQFHPHLPLYTVGYATTNDTTTNKCYYEQFLSIKSGCYNEHRCYNKRGGILSADVARACTWRFGPSRFDKIVSHHLCYPLYGWVISLVICLFVQCMKVKWIRFISFLHLYFWFYIIFFLFKWFCWMVTLL